MHFRTLHILILRGQGNDTIITQAFDSLVSGRKISVNMLSNLQLIESDREIKERPKRYNRIWNIAGMYSIYLVYTNVCNISAQLMIQCLSLSDNASLPGTSMNVKDNIV